MMKSPASAMQAWLLGLAAFFAGILLTILIMIAATNVGRSTYLTSVGVAMDSPSIDIITVAASKDTCTRVARDLGPIRHSVGIAASDLGIAMRREILYYELTERWAELGTLDRVSFLVAGLSPAEIALAKGRVENRRKELRSSLQLASGLGICGQHS